VLPTECSRSRDHKKSIEPLNQKEQKAKGRKKKQEVAMSHLPVICDNGTGYVKTGFAGENFPSCVFPSMVGRPLMRYEEEFKDVVLKDIMVGDECAANRSFLEINYPVENGIVRSWDDMKHLYDYTFFDRLKIKPAEHKIMLTEPPVSASRRGGGGGEGVKGGEE